MEDTIKKTNEELLMEAREIAYQHSAMKETILKMLESLDALEKKQMDIFEQIKNKK